MTITYSIDRCPCTQNLNYNYHLVDVNLHGDWFAVTVTASAFVAQTWLNDTLNLNQTYLQSRTLIVGLAIQWTPPAGGHASADTVQLCVGDRCLIFQITRADRVPLNLRRFLRNPEHTFVGMWNRFDRRKLRDSRHALMMEQNPIDLRSLMSVELAHSPLETIVETCLGYAGVRTRNEISISQWNLATLTDQQILQASILARCYFLIGQNFQAWRFCETVTRRPSCPSSLLEEEEILFPKELQAATCPFLQLLPLL
ncbi:hypothetical protein VNO77_23751 [Canavalia gladiata]|uniref:Uncharacterized protein n=1 Tax=Canavalia gladiata TaxID=3824 RepID=A0AAN9L5T1_CANGL